MKDRSLFFDLSLFFFIEFAYLNFKVKFDKVYFSLSHDQYSTI
jgi:hypothetical protein